MVDMRYAVGISDMVYVVLNLCLKDKCTNFFRLKYKSQSVDQVNKAAMSS